MRVRYQESLPHLVSILFIRRCTNSYVKHEYKTIGHLTVHWKKLAVNSDKEAYWLSIQSQDQIGCQFVERVNQPPVIFHPAYVSL